MTTAWSSWLFCRNTLGEELEQDVSEHCQRYLDRTAQRYCQSLQTYSAEEAAHHDRLSRPYSALKKEPKLYWETHSEASWCLSSGSLSGSQMVQVYTGAEKSFRYIDIAKALQDTWRNDSRLQAHEPTPRHGDEIRTFRWCCAHRDGTRQFLWMRRTGVTTTGLEMTSTTLSPTRRLRTLTGKTLTKVSWLGMVQTDKKIHRLGSRSSLRNTHTM